MRLERFYKRPESPTDIRSDHEVVLFASDTGRLKVKNYDHEEHTLAYLDEIDGGSGGDGIQFDTYEGGSWLDLSTTGGHPGDTSGNRGSMYFESTFTPDSWYKPSILFRAPNGGFRIETVNYYLQMGIYSPRAAHMTYAEPFGNLQLDANELDFVGNQRIHLDAPIVELYQSGVLVFKIDSTGYHIKSGATWQADL